jgi:hypothetical protein
MSGFVFVLIYCGKSHPNAVAQGASLTFQGDLVDQSQTALAKFLAQKHDHRAAQMIHFVYHNGSVWSYNLPVWLQLQNPNRYLLQWRSSTTEQSPQLDSTMDC